MLLMHARARVAALAAACLAGMAFVTVIPAGDALASGGGDGCNPGRANNYLSYYFDGAHSQNVSGAPGGVYASIKNYSPFVAGPNQGAPSNDDVSEWVMLDDGTHYAQIGWIEFAGSVRNTFAEWTTSGTNFTDQFSSAFPINSTQRYTVLYQPGNTNPYVLEVNGGAYYYVPHYFTPNDAQIFAETHTAASQIPGGTADNTTETPLVSDAHVWPTAGSSSSWQNFDGATQVAGASWGRISPAPGSTANSWRTWDTACRT